MDPMIASARRFASFFFLALVFVTTVPAATAQGMSFKDLPTSHSAYAAVQYLTGLGILKGYDDGTFRPDKKVARSEAIKIIVSAVAQGKTFTPGTSSYTDIPDGAWYEPYVAYAWKELGIVDGPPTATLFRGDKNVTKVEFLKMLLLAYKVDPKSFGEIQLPLASDVTDPGAWYYPYMRYAITASMTTVQSDGAMGPSQELSRAQVALLLHRFLTYRDGRRTQALLSSTESDLVNVLKMLEAKDLSQAEYASARALLAARGALQSKPDTPLVQGALKTTEAFRALVRAYRAGSEQRFDDAVTLAKESWSLAEAARQKSSDLDGLSSQVQGLAKEMADSARDLKTKSAMPTP